MLNAIAWGCFWNETFRYYLIKIKQFHTFSTQSRSDEDALHNDAENGPILLENIGVLK